MTLGFEVGTGYWPVGSPDLLHAFFSTISQRLESGYWGSRFPVLLGQLYQGEIAVGWVETALSELSLARRELSWFTPSQVVWDIDDLHAQPPWGSAIASSVPNLSRYFYTVEGRDLFDVLATALSVLQQQPDGSLRIVSGVREHSVA